MYVICHVPQKTTSLRVNVNLWLAAPNGMSPHYSSMFDDHKLCDCGDMFLISHLTSCKHMFKRL